MNLRWVLFDYADTLAEIVPSKNLQVISFLREIGWGIEPDMKEVAKAFSITEEQFTISSIMEISKEAHRLFYLEFNRELFSNLGITNADVPLMFYDYISTEKRSWQLKRDTEPLLRHLFEQEFKLGLLTNFDVSLKSILKAQGISHYFSAIQISSEIGLEKPDICFFKKFLFDNDIDVAKSVYLGDNFRLDIEPMIEIGVKAILLDELGVKNSTNLSISSLWELPAKI